MSEKSSVGINRRDFMKRSGLSGLAATGLGAGLARAGRAASASQGDQSAQGRRRPNVVVIMSDDHRQEAMSCMGNPYISTPRLDQLAAEGVLFENAFCVAGVCSPNRAATLTGQYAHQCGAALMAWVNKTFINQAEPFPKRLQQTGYHTAYIGKWHLGNGHLPKEGYDLWAGFQWVGDFFNQPVWFNGQKQETEGFADDVLAGIAADYIRERAQQNDPFCVFLALKAPHLPFSYPPRHEDALDGVTIPPPDSLHEDYSVSGRAPEIRDSLMNIHTFPGGLKGFGDSWEQYIKSYYRSALSIDDNVGRVMDVLDEAGIEEDTIVIYTTDQGYNLGEHQLCEKHYAYEETMRIPLIFRYPRLGTPGTRPDQIALNIDIAPTVMDLCGAGVPEDMTGRSWRPILEESVADWREDFLFDQTAESTAVRSQLAVRTQDYKLITYPRLEHLELYDLRKDPGEMNNVAYEAAYGATVLTMKRRLDRLVKETGWRQYRPHYYEQCLALGPVDEADVPLVERALLYYSFSDQDKMMKVGEKTFSWKAFEALPNHNFMLEERFGFAEKTYCFLAMPVRRLIEYDPFTILRYVPFRPIRAYVDGEPVLDCDEPGWEATLNPVLSAREHWAVLRFALEGNPAVQLHLFAPDGAVDTK